jgi:hypothetical protein
MHQPLMNRIEIHRALYESRCAYLKAKKEMEFHQSRIKSLKWCEEQLNNPPTDLFQELFGDTPLFDEVYGG